MDLTHEDVVLNILKSAHLAGRPGMYRSDIYGQEECEGFEKIDQVSSALHKLFDKGLIRKGERDGTSGCLWRYIDPDGSNRPGSSIEHCMEPPRNNSLTADCDNDPSATIEQELDAIAGRLEFTPHTIARPAVKTQVLERLAEITSGTIAVILREIAEDIKRIAAR